MVFYRLDDPEGRRRWEALQATRASPFAHPLFLEALGQLFDRPIEVVEVEEAETHDTAAVALLVRQQGPWRLATHPPLLPESPLICTTSSDKAALPGRLLTALTRRYARIDLHLPPQWLDVRPALWSGWHAHPLYTYEIDLAQTSPTHWSENPRRLFRKAASAYRLIEDVALAPVLAHLVEASYQRHHRRPPAPAPRLTPLLETLATSGLIRLFGAQHATGHTEAAVALMVHPPRVWYWLAGSKPGPAMTVLLGHLWPRLRAEGFRWFDFVGANTPSIAEFKRRFNPKLRLYFRLTYDRSLLQALLRHVPGLR
ncbi:MAG: GNAT family N-acetyltransferase [Rhodothermus sp.]|nr:GNAT family N-acetyltransferase [Rhodothermus sp.]